MCDLDDDVLALGNREPSLDISVKGHFDSGDSLLCQVFLYFALDLSGLEYRSEIGRIVLSLKDFFLCDTERGWFKLSVETLVEPQDVAVFLLLVG